ncbi:uncharacterized protein TNCV_1087311 [Trichonephila clavipes]|nr:uncharacterized protein TNCV_1087311 [Trichonephila clavipes]
MASLSTDSFLLALRRFISRRGRPKVIYSDNGSNFREAFHELSSLDWKAIMRETNTERIVWKLNPPTASWWGGWWERLIWVIQEHCLEEPWFRSRFKREYLSQLIQRHKQNKDRREPRVGEIILVGNDSKKRINWPLAVIVELVPGRDGNVRAVKVKTHTGVFLRPIQRIFPLEIDSNGHHSLDMKGQVDDGIHDLNAENQSPEKRYVSDNEVIRELFFWSLN